MPERCCAITLQLTYSSKFAFPTFVNFRTDCSLKMQYIKQLTIFSWPLMPGKKRRSSSNKMYFLVFSDFFSTAKYVSFASLYAIKVFFYNAIVESSTVESRKCQNITLNPSTTNGIIRLKTIFKTTIGIITRLN